MIKFLYTLIAVVSTTCLKAQIDTMPVKQDTGLTITDTVKANIDSAAIVKTGKVIRGIASFYSASLEGTKTATGEIFRHAKFTGASNNLKLNTWVKVTNLNNGNTVIVRINDRMHPAMKRKGRVIDLSRTAAKQLDFIKSGLTKVKLEVIERPSSQENNKR